MRNALRILVLAFVLAAPAAAAPTAAGPVAKALPAVVGTARVGEQITGTNGTWTGSGTISYAYRWDRCDAAGNNCTPVAGATRLTYPLTPADVGKALGLVVTAKDASGSTVADAGLIGPIAAASALANIGRPFVSGTASVGATLNATAGIWTKPPTAIAYSWLRCNAVGRACVAIAAATASSYVPATADVGHTLVARLQGTVGTASQVVLSVPTAVVAGGAPPVTTTTTTTSTTPVPATGASARPPVTGTAQVGQRLTGTIAGATAYQWYRCDPSGAHCSSVHGAVKATYTVVAKDAGHTLGLTVQIGGSPVYASLVGPVAPASALASTAQPALSGKAVQGQALTVTPGGWTPSAASVSYAWQRCNANGRICTAIAGAAAATYVPVAADVGHALAALVTATVSGKTQAALSVASDAVAVPPVLAATMPPAVTGMVKVGQQLAGTTGRWTGTAPITYAFQWYRCDATGAHCSSVHGATKQTYRLAKADAGRTIGLTVTAADATAKTPAYASLVGPVAASAATLASTAQPTIVVQGQTLTVGAGAWTATPASTTYQWERCNANGRICVVIAGATSASYTSTSADSGHELAALVTAHAGSATAAALSAGAKAP